MSSTLSAVRDVESDYLEAAVEKYAVGVGTGSAAERAANELVPVLREWAGRYLVDIGLSGSYAKGTATSLGTDVDVFVSLSDVAGRSMKDIYWGLFWFLADRGLGPQAQNVSVRVARNGVLVDVVPGRLQRREGSESHVSKSGRRGAGASFPQGLKPPSMLVETARLKPRPFKEPFMKHAAEFQSPQTWGTGDHTLYRRKKDSWVQTNVGEHIRLVAESGRTREIRALKIWRERNRLDFPSFYLELTVIRALSGIQTESLAGNVRRALEYLADDFPRARVVDPANSNNVISDDLEPEEKRVIAVAARKAVERIGGTGGYRGPSTPQSDRFADRSAALRMTTGTGTLHSPLRMTGWEEALRMTGWEQVIW